MKGKKQRDIREDNKSLVIECLLNCEMTTADLEEELKLSHTTLLKVINELKTLNIVRDLDIQTGRKGRPSQIYDINPDCAFAATICLGMRNLEIFIVDMKGFQVNKYVSNDEFSNVNQFIDFSLSKLNELLQHERTNNKTLSTICISIPFNNCFKQEYNVVVDMINNGYKSVYKNTQIVVNNNNDYWAFAERKYGKLKNINYSAILCELDNNIAMSFYYKKNNYIGEKPTFNSFNQLFDKNIVILLENELKMRFEEIVSNYNMQNSNVVEAVHRITLPFIEKIGNIAELLCVKFILLSGLLCNLGELFLRFINNTLNAKNRCIRVEFTGFSDRSPYCAGAVLMASYDSLKSLL